MTKKDYRDEYFDKLDKIANLKASGAISEEEYKEEKARLDDMKSKSEIPAKPPIFSLIIVGLLIIAIWWLVAAIISDKPEPARPLNILVGKNATGILLTNSEEAPLTNCKVILNDDYSTRVGIIDSEERTYAYADFVNSDAARFNILALKPTTIFVHGCKEGADRSGSYSF